MRNLVPRLEHAAWCLERYARTGEIADLVLGAYTVEHAFPNRSMPHPGHPNPLVTVPQRSWREGRGAGTRAVIPMTPVP